MIKTLVAIGLIATLSAPALAGNHSWQIGTDSFHIYYTDLDVTSNAGRAMLLRRVERAAVRLCRDRRNRAECVARTVELASRDSRSGSLIRTALAERDHPAIAAK